jgi:hypothetical protein
LSVEECIDTLARRSCVEDADGCETLGGDEAFLGKAGKFARFFFVFDLHFLCSDTIVSMKCREPAGSC